MQERIGTTNPVWILTAWNPRSEPMSLVENEERQQSLLSELEKGPGKFLPVDATAISGDWIEKSFAIWGPHTRLATEVEERVAGLARRFEQNAVFKFEGNLQTLVPVLVKEAVGSQIYCLNQCSIDS